jgi:hypothetical protein
MRLAEARIDLNQSLRLHLLAAIQIVGTLSLGEISTPHPTDRQRRL